MTSEMMDALKVLGKEWHKDNMHRFYSIKEITVDNL